MKTHEEFEALLDAFVDGELSPEELRAVQNHLNTCPSCQAYVDDALAIRAAFPTAEDTPLPEGFADSVMRAVRATSPKKQTQPWKKLLLPLAACMAIVVVQTLHPTYHHDPDSGSNARMAAGAAAEEYALEPAMEAPAESAPAPEDPAREVLALEDESPYCMELTLTADEAGDRFADLTPLEETEQYTRYALPLADYRQLVEDLKEAGLEIDAQLPPQADESSEILITVLH